MRYSFVIVGLLLASPVLADFESDKRDCVNGVLLARINACSRLIQSGRFKALDQAVAYHNRGVGYGQLRRHRRAIQGFDKALRLNPKYAKTYFNRGNAYNRLKQYHRAIQDYNGALRLNPTYAKVYYNRGFTYETLGEKQSAIRDYRAYLRLVPGDKNAIAALKALGASP